MRFREPLLLCLFSMITFAAPRQTLTPHFFFPPEGSIPGYRIESSSCFNGSALSNRDLFSIIDGGAEVYTENGFIEALFQGLSDSVGNTICIHLFKHSSEKQSMKVFTRLGGDVGQTIAQSYGSAGRMDTAMIANTVTEFVAAQFFVRIIAGKRTEDTKNVEYIARYIEAAIQRLKKK